MLQITLQSLGLMHIVPGLGGKGLLKLCSRLLVSGKQLLSLDLIMISLDRLIKARPSLIVHASLMRADVGTENPTQC